MPLEEYRRKRRFDVTKEPAGAKAPKKRKTALAYVIQKHRATALHYDFRLEWNGVLLSWAVPKGPSLDPTVKRMATHVEDHPLEYATFEGIIPAGEYGGGTVMVWDRGTWEPGSPDVDAALAKGDLKFTLQGEKLKGSWVLVRTRGWGSSKRPSWLLIKHRDDFASDEEIAETRPRSAVSNRLLTEIAIDEGGDVEKASTGDPVGEVERLLADPKKLQRARKENPAVWHSNKSVAENVAYEEHQEKISEKGKRGEPPARPARIGSSPRASEAQPLSKKSPSSLSALSRSFPVPVSNPNKIFWPEEGYTKSDLIAFYAGVFPKLAPWVRDRPLSLERCPDGLLGQPFYQKEKPSSMPADTPTVAVRHGKERKVTNTVVGGKLETQLALANLGCIAVHVWGSRADDLDRPDWVCFDLDPDTGLLVDAVGAALKVKQALDALDLSSFVKTSGGKGLHVFVPIKRGPTADEVTWFAKELGARLAAAWPKELTMEMRIAARKGRVFLDSFRNAFGQTVVSPYSVRRREHAPVSTPLLWSEVVPSIKAEDFTIGNFAQRLKKSDPWAGFFRRRQALKRAIDALKRL
ncbi:MAG TPA: non-homologous end-joining DNA ligase [Thermoanaerobaculia bacterium]|nr:non-homologous end-joining DNA ligase [Thermoanaerobaculia bacterium]